MDDLDVAADVATARPRNCAPELEVIAVNCGVCRKPGTETGSGVATAWRRRRRRTERTRSTSTKGVTRIAPASTTRTVTAATRTMATTPTKARAGTHRRKPGKTVADMKIPTGTRAMPSRMSAAGGSSDWLRVSLMPAPSRGKGPMRSVAAADRSDCGRPSAHGAFDGQLAGTAGADSYEPPRRCKQIGPAAVARWDSGPSLRPGWRAPTAVRAASISGWRRAIWLRSRPIGAADRGAGSPAARRRRSGCSRRGHRISAGRRRRYDLRTAPAPSHPGEPDRWAFGHVLGVAAQEQEPTAPAPAHEISTGPDEPASSRWRRRSSPCRRPGRPPGTGRTSPRRTPSGPGRWCRRGSGHRCRCRAGGRCR